MSEITIQVPAEHLEAIRTGLAGRSEDRDEEARRLLAQLAVRGPGDDGPRKLTGSRTVLWGAVYDALCTTAERLAEDCNEYWRDVVDPDAIRTATVSLGSRFELLVALGPPPGD
jgi:hypothetical protein